MKPKVQGVKNHEIQIEHPVNFEVVDCAYLGLLKQLK